MITTPATTPQRRSMMKRQIPTLLGLIVLIAGLAIGAILFSNGTGIFLPRATPETTPKSIRISNVSDQGFTVSFMTDAATSGFIRYGTDPKKLTQIGDQRDQLTGAVGEYTLHQISVLRGLEPNTVYHYVLGTGKGTLFDDDGEPFTIKTGRQIGTQPRALTVFGSAVTASGAPGAGAIVFVTPPNASTLSSLVTNTGSWAVSLSSARTKDGNEYAKIEIGDELALQVLAVNPADNTQLTARVESETSIAIVLGADQALDPLLSTPATAAPESATAAAELVNFSDESGTASPGTATDSMSSLLASTDGATSTNSAGLGSPVNDATSPAIVTVVDLTGAEPASGSTPPVVETTNPTITGTAKPNVTITIQVNSEHQIDAQIVADANGNFELDISKYEQELEPGPHTITYSYVDPNTGESVTKTRAFTVAPRIALAAATPTPTPFSSSNPYPIGTSSATSTTSATSTKSATSTTSAQTATPTANLSTTTSSLLASGSVGSTFLLIGGGLFFMISGLWSWWVSRELVEEYESA